MKKIALLFLSATIMLGVTQYSQATTIGFDPNVTGNSYSVGDSVDVDIIVSGLGNNNSPSVGAFDIFISYSSYVLDFTSLTFGDPVLGDQLDFLGFDLPAIGFADFAEYGNTVVNLFEVSLDPVWLLDLMQADSFTLATLTFDVLNTGKSVLDLRDLQSKLIDANGQALAVNFNDGKISVPEAVPEPATFWLFALGLLGAYRLNRRKFRMPSAINAKDL